MQSVSWSIEISAGGITSWWAMKTAVVPTNSVVGIIMIMLSLSASVWVLVLMVLVGRSGGHGWEVEECPLTHQRKAYFTIFTGCQWVICGSVLGYGYAFTEDLGGEALD